MQRMVISLTENDKIWLAKRAKTEHKSIAEVIRQAIHCFQEQHERKQMAKKQRILFYKVVVAGIMGMGCIINKIYGMNGNKGDFRLSYHY